MQKIYTLLTAIFLVPMSLSAQNWTQIGNEIDGENVDDWCGESVAIDADGNTVIIGAARHDATGTNAGHVRVFDWNGSAWNQRGNDIHGDAAYDHFGGAVAISDNGNIIAVGAKSNDGSGTDAGHVRVFEWNGNSWVQKGGDLEGEAGSDFLGRAVALNATGSVLAAGASGNDDNGTSAGQVRVYSWNGVAWVQKGADLDGDAALDFFGTTVDLDASGDVVIAGGHKNDGAGTDAGHAKIFLWNGSSWVQKGSDIDGESPGDLFGNAVSISNDGDRVAIGGFYNAQGGSQAGHARLYEWNGSSWIQMGSDIDGTNFDDRFGSSISLSGDGTKVAIGGPQTALNSAGYVKIYKWNGNAWNQNGTSIAGEASYDRFGWVVSMSDDGNSLAVGAPVNDGIVGQNSGHARLYNSPCTPNVGTDVQTACDAYTWIDGNTYNTDNNSATYTLTNANGCDSVVTLNLTIVTVDVGVTISATGSSPILTADASGATYQWLDCDNNMAPIPGETGQSFTAMTNGSYAVSVTVGNCTEVSSCFAIVDLGLADENQNAIAVYPNPVVDKVTVSTQMMGVTAKIRITDLNGRVVHYSEARVDDTVDVDMSTLQRGVYTISVQADGQFYTNQLIKL